MGTSRCQPGWCRERSRSPNLKNGAEKQSDGWCDSAPLSLITRRTYQPLPGEFLWQQLESCAGVSRERGRGPQSNRTGSPYRAPGRRPRRDGGLVQAQDRRHHFSARGWSWPFLGLPSAGPGILPLRVSLPQDVNSLDFRNV